MSTIKHSSIHNFFWLQSQWKVHHELRFVSTQCSRSKCVLKWSQIAVSGALVRAMGLLTFGGQGFLPQNGEDVKELLVRRALHLHVSCLSWLTVCIDGRVNTQSPTPSS